MIGIILIAHAGIASETKAAVEYILQEQQNFVAINIVNSDETEQQTKAFKESLQDMSQCCDGVLVMADIFGATPCNIAMNAIAKGNYACAIELIAGFNLPTLIKTMLEREHHDVQSLAHLSLDAGQKYMRLGSQEYAMQAAFESSKIS